MESRDSIAQARLAYITAGAPPVAGPRRAAPESLDEALAQEDPATEPVIDVAVEPAPSALISPVWRRLEFSRRHVVAVLIVLGVGVLVALGVMVTSSATPVTIEVSTPDADQSITPREAPVTEPEPTPGLIRIHVLGAVRQPGVVEVAEGSIVQDAVRAAGGFSPDADPAQLNLAAPLSAGQQIIVGTVHEPLGEVRGGGPEGDQPAAGEPLNLNRATASQLEELPGVGPVLASAIIAWREDNGGFTAVEDLQEVSGIGPKNFEKLAPLVTV